MSDVVGALEGDKPERVESLLRSGGVSGLAGVARRRWGLLGGDGGFRRSWERRGWRPLLEVEWTLRWRDGKKSMS